MSASEGQSASTRIVTRSEQVAGATNRAAAAAAATVAAAATEVAEVEMAVVTVAVIVRTGKVVEA